MPGSEVRRLSYVVANRPYFWNAVNGHICEVVPHANQESKCGNYCAILSGMHTYVKLCYCMSPRNKLFGDNDPKSCDACQNMTSCQSKLQC